jgi:predicted DNA-binding transcriptional regulator AlpA
MSRKYLRKVSVAARYGVTPRAIEYMVKDGRLPAPVYLHGSRFPLWLESALDANERAAAVARPRRANQNTAA